MPSATDRLLNAVERCVSILGVAALAILLCGVVAQVTLRYGFGVTPLWSEEIGRYLLIWTVLIGSALSVRGDEHIRVDLLVRLMPAKVARIWNAAMRLLALGVFVLLTVLGIDAMIFLDGMNSSGLQIPLSWPFAAVPVFFALSAVFAAVEVLRGPTTGAR